MLIFVEFSNISPFIGAPNFKRIKHQLHFTLLSKKEHIELPLRYPDYLTETKKILINTLICCRLGGFALQGIHYKAVHFVYLLHVKQTYAKHNINLFLINEKVTDPNPIVVY